MLRRPPSFFLLYFITQTPTSPYRLPGPLGGIAKRLGQKRERPLPALGDLPRQRGPPPWKQTSHVVHRWEVLPKRQGKRRERECCWEGLNFQMPGRLAEGSWSCGYPPESGADGSREMQAPGALQGIPIKVFNGFKEVPDLASAALPASSPAFTSCSLHLGLPGCLAVSQIPRNVPLFKTMACSVFCT